MIRFAILLSFALLHPSPRSKPPAPRPMLGSHYENADTGQTGKQTRQTQRGSDTVPLVVKVLRTDADQQAFKRDSSERAERSVIDQDMAKWTKVLGVATVLLAAGSVVSLVLLFFQGQDLKEQRGILKQQAGHLKATVDRMKKTARQQLRAYVGVEPSGVTPYQSWGQGPIAGGLTIHNAGATPGRGLTADYSFQPRAIDFDPRTKLPLPPTDGGTISRGTVWPNAPQSMAIHPPLVLKTAEWLAIQANEMALFCLCTVRYMDVFGKSRQTNRAWTIELQADATTWLATEHGNDDT